MKIGIVGASGAVGRELIKLIEQRSFGETDLKLFNSKNPVTHQALKGLDLIFFACDKKFAKEFAEEAAKHAYVIDLSNAFRETHPLIIPEINPHHIGKSRLIASPNCTTTLMLMALFPLHQKYGLKQIITSTYQAASGAGQKAVDELLAETKAFSSNNSFSNEINPFPYAFNIFLHPSPVNDRGYSEEELKMERETHKILGNASINISSTCVRVPTLRAHSLSIHATFEADPLDPETVIEKQSGVTLFKEGYPMPINAAGRGEVLVGRVRKAGDHSIELWVVGDQLLKGAALNALQIAEVIFM